MGANDIKIEMGIPLPGGAKRERSTVEFPYTALDTAIEIAKAVHQVGGSQCQWDQLGAKLNMAADGGGFRQRVLSAKTFGFVTYSGGIVTLTRLGTQMCDPDQEAAAKVEAFLTVPLYRKVYEEFKNGTLPGPVGLETALVTMGVAQKQKDKARQAFQRSATEAGFFAFGPNRLVLPAVKVGKKPEENGGVKIADGDGDPNSGKHKGDGGDGGNGHHPLIEGLIKALPKAGSDWSLAARKKWLQAAAMNFDYVYAGSTDDEGSIKVSVERENSAK